jgi:hypothetical protein
MNLPSAQCKTFLLIQNKSWFSFEHCAGLQGSSSARRKCREESFKGWQKFILQSTQANKKLGSNRIDTVETVDNVLWLGNIFLHPGASHRRRKCGVCHAISTTGDNWGKSNSRGRRGKPKEERPQERQLELLAEVRRRRELEMLQREQLSSQAETVKDESAVKIWPFWRKKEFKLRALTRRIVELSNRKQLGKVSVHVILNLPETSNPNP